MTTNNQTNQATNNTTELVFILDKSGSMAGMEKDTIGGFNSMIEKQKQAEGKAYVSTVLFSNASQILHDRKDVTEIAPLTETDYRVGGGTALLDAIGETINHIGSIHKYIRPEDVPQRTVFVITTDGMENVSRIYSHNKIKAMIKEQEEKHGWEFIFLAANIDAGEVAESMGIRRDRAVNYSVAEETTEMYEELGERLCCCRVMPMEEDFAAKFEERIKARKQSKK